VTRFEDVEQAMKKFGGKLQEIKNIIMDMSATYALVFNDWVPRAVQIIDKFHVMKYVYEAVGDVRKRTVRELTARLSKEKKRTAEGPKILEQIDLLRRITHAITQSSDKWNDEMKETINQVFAMHNELKTACQISQNFECWYRYENSVKPTEQIK
jgi:transposase